jgi:Ca2+-transporting ATPase
LEKKEYHSLDIDTILRRLDSNKNGLSSQEVKKRLLEFGPNELEEEKGISPFQILLNQFKQFLIIILLIATLISLFMGEAISAVVIFAIVIASAILGFVQEYRAGIAVEALKKLVTTSVTVIRNGREENIMSHEIVPGDIISLSPGDKVTADSRIIDVNNLRINESALTGEAAPVAKDPRVLPVQTGVYARKNMVFAGTVVTYGRAKAIVTSSGMRTELGKIASILQEIESEETPLEKRMAHLGRVLGIVSLAIVVVVFSLGLLRGNDLLEMLLWGISLAVAAVPEALTAVVTGSLAMGMQAMAKQKAVVKRLPAVETLGSTSVICSDKTGTLTKGEMTVREIYYDRKTIRVTGVGYSPEGRIVDEPAGCCESLVQTSLLCNDSRLKDCEGSCTIEGDPTEGALTVLAMKSGLDSEEIKKKFQRIGEIVFSSERKLMTTIDKDQEGKIFAHMKGAPEEVLKRCTKILFKDKILDLKEEEKKLIETVNEKMAKKALRVIGLAFRVISSDLKEFDDSLEEEMIFIGLAGMIDPPRKEAKEAVNLCTKAGIRVIMITGDNKHTAIAIARELGILDKGKVLTGQDLETMSDESLEDKIDEISVFARVSPGDKMNIVKALKRKEHIVAVTGDGVNDAPALKASDIGVAMGITGTEASKEAADMILLDDNFATLVTAIEKGRVIYNNIKKFLAYTLSSNMGELLIMLTAGIMGLPLPLITIQILWVNLVTDGLPGIALGVDPPEKDVMKYPPRKTDETVFTSGIKAIVIVMSILMTITLVPIFFSYGFEPQESELLKARTIVFTSIVIFEMFNTFNCRSERLSIFQVGLFKNRYLLVAILSSIVLQLSVVYIPMFQPIFGTTAISIFDWILIIGISSTGLIGVELTKIFLKRRKNYLPDSKIN